MADDMEIGRLQAENDILREAVRHAKNSLNEIKETDLGMLGLYEYLRDVLRKTERE